MAIAVAVVISTCLACWVVIILIAKKKRKAARQDSSWGTMRSSDKDITGTSDSRFQNPQFLSSHLEDDALASAYFGAKKFSYSELEEATNHFDLSKELGDGGFGSVYQGRLRDGREVAVKRLYEANVGRAVQFMNEVEILTQLRHQNLVALYGFSSNNVKNLRLVYEFVPNGTLADHLRRAKSYSSSFLSWSLRLNIAIETADALAYLHASDIIHRDVKTSNILLDSNFHVKVADFGLSRLFPEDVNHISTNPQGTPGYLDPEYNKYCQLTEKSDVYSFGVVLIQLLSSLPAFDIRRKK